jgi:oxaloacetate decarboxylase beta subunit
MGMSAVDLIDKIYREQNKTIVIIEHRLEDVLYRHVDRIILMNEGKIIMDTTPDELLRSNLLKESGVVPKLVETAQNSLMYIVTIFLGLTVGATANAETLLTMQTLGVTAMGLVAFSVGTASGVLFGKIMCKATGGKVNPMIGAAGVSAVPMAARVVQKVGQSENPSNFLLMHAMGPNVSGVIGSAVVAGILLKFFM